MFLINVYQEFEKLFHIQKSQELSALHIHATRLACLHKHLKDLRSHLTCLCCLMRTPDKVLTCGHAVCNDCISAFGTRSPDERHSFRISFCMLCGDPNEGPCLQLIPPTAGVRILSLDGGGVRGIISLVILTALEQRFSVFQCPLYDFFDFVCGTSAGKENVRSWQTSYTHISGGLVIIGLFLMQWSAAESMRRFEDLAGRILKKEGKSTLMFSRVQELATSYWQDWKYSSAATKETYHTTLGKQTKMFNPLSNDTKVAVTTKSACEAIPCLFTNYNGWTRPEGTGKSAQLFTRFKLMMHQATA